MTFYAQFIFFVFFCQGMHHVIMMVMLIIIDFVMT